MKILLISNFFQLMMRIITSHCQQGLCRYLEKLFLNLKERGVVVGFDARHNSER